MFFVPAALRTLFDFLTAAESILTCASIARVYRRRPGLHGSYAPASSLASADAVSRVFAFSDCGCILTLVSTFSRDGGWIRTLLEEAENERMHLLTFMKVCVFFFSLPYRLDF